MRVKRPTIRRRLISTVANTATAESTTPRKSPTIDMKATTTTMKTAAISVKCDYDLNCISATKNAERKTPTTDFDNRYGSEKKRLPVVDSTVRVGARA